MHLHLCTEHVKQIEGKADILSIAMEVEYNFVTAILAG